MANPTPFLTVVSRDEAQRRFSEAVRLEPLQSEMISLDSALGRILSDSVFSCVNVPSFDRSNFDGYAIHASDLYGAQEEVPARLLLCEHVVETGKVPGFEVQNGQAARISTGGMLPRGADAIVLVEDCTVDEQTVYVRRAVEAGHGISTTGSDIAIGELVLPMGTELTSRETGVLAAIGQSQVPVWRKPRVAVISTGNEVISPDGLMQPGLVYDSNARMIADAVREVGGEPVELGIAIDDETELRLALQKGLESADLVVMSGGTSKGEGDLCYRVVSELKDPGIVVHGVALKPGKPICLAASNGKPVVVLPGFPTSAIFTFHEFVIPVIRAFESRVGNSPTAIKAQLPFRVRSEAGRTEFLLVGLVPGEEDDSQESLPMAYPMGKGSGSVTTFARADGFIKLDPETELVAAGEVRTAYMFARRLEPAELLIMGSHCPGIDLLLTKLRNRHIHARFFPVGSEAGLEAVQKSRCDIAGIHLYDPSTNSYNSSFIDPTKAQWVRGYQRQQGLIFRKQHAELAGRTPESALEFILSNPSLRMVNRNPGSGTRIHIDRWLRGHRPDGYSMQVQHHTAVAAAIEQKRADFGVAVRHVCSESDCHFIPLTIESFDFAIANSRADRNAVKAFFEVLHHPETRSELLELGYHIVG
jgi:putative molybdopterin biosynthesis protein